MIGEHALKTLMRASVKLRRTVGGLRVLNATNEEFGQIVASKDCKALFHGRNEPYWPFVWAGGWALSQALLERHKPGLGTHVGSQPLICPSTVEMVLDIGCGGGICGLAALSAPTPARVSGIGVGTPTRPPVVIFNDVDGTALEAARLNLDESCRAGCFPWVTPSRRRSAGLTQVRRRAIFEKRNLLAMSESDLGSAMKLLIRKLLTAESRWALEMRKLNSSEPDSRLFDPGSQKQEAKPRLLVLCGDITYTAETADAVLRTASVLLRMALDVPGGPSAIDCFVDDREIDSSPSGRPVNLLPPLFASVTVLVSDPGRHAFTQLLHRPLATQADAAGVLSAQAQACHQGHGDPSLQLQLTEAPVLKAHGLAASIIASYTAPLPQRPSTSSARPAQGSCSRSAPRTGTRLQVRNDDSEDLLEEAAVEGLGGHSRDIPVLQLRLAQTPPRFEPRP